MSMLKEKDKEELVLLKMQVEELQRKLFVKDELLESAEKSRNQLNALNAKLDQLKHQASEKDSLLKSTQQQLFDVKVLIYFLFCFLNNLARWVANLFRLWSRSTRCLSW